MDSGSVGPAPPHSMVLYDNDEVESVFQNGTCIKLSPCGANVVIPVKLPVTCHPVNLPHQLHQRTQFVTHHQRKNVQRTLEFRNRFAERIFLCQEILGVENVVDFYANVKSVSWPTSSDAVTALDDGGLQLTSTDECATITLAPNRQEFSVQFLCQFSSVPQRETRAANSKPIPDTEGTDISNSASVFTTVTSSQRLRDVSHKLNFDSCISNDLKSQRSQARMTKASQKSKTRLPEVKENDSLRKSYAWQIQNFSVDHCPQNWCHPLDILTKASSILRDGSGRTRVDSVEERSLSQTEPEANENHKEKQLTSFSINRGKTSDLPISLPLRCPHSHMHEMSQVAMPKHDEEEERIWMESRRIKVFFSRGAIFRIFWKPQPCLEIYPGDGSVLKSMPGDGQYFSYFCLRHGQHQEQLLSVKSPPPNSVRCSTHSLSSLLQRGHRFLCHMIFIDRNTNCSPENICWKMEKTESQPSTAKPAQLMEECQVDGMGHFVAFSNGYVRVIFIDRTTMEFQIDIHDESDVPKDFNKKPSDAHRIRLFPENVSRVLLPNGIETVINLKNPGRMERYARIANEWAAWISLPTSQRRAAYRDTIYDLDKISLVDQELQRLRQFTSDGETKFGNIATPSLPQDCTGISFDDISNTEVQLVLERTSAKIKDIDNVLTVT